MRDIMKKGMIKKGLEICIVLFFVGTSFSPIICGNTYLTNTSNIKEKKLLKDPPTEMWNKTFGGFLDEAGASVKQTNDGGYIITGKKITSEFTKEDVLLLKTDSNGNEIWSTTFGGSDVDFGWEVLEANDGGFVIIGTITSFGFQYGDIWLIKTNNNGVMIWNRTFGGTAADWGYSIDKTNDGGYILSGVTGSYGYGYDLWLIKTNQFGIEEWNQSFGSLDTVGEGRSVQQTEDGGFIVTGFNSPFIVDYDVWLIKTDQSGNQENFWR
jgi:hypothetical protein